MNKVIKDATDAWYRTASAATSFVELDYINEIVRPDEQVIVKVRFYTPASKQWSNTIYEYFIKPNIKMKVGGLYLIENESGFKYTNPVKVIGFSNTVGKATHYIAKATSYKEKEKETSVEFTKIPVGLVPQKVVFDVEKGVTVVIWTKGLKTKLRLARGDVFDKEKAIALAYMKLMMGNKSKFNEVIKKFCE